MAFSSVYFWESPGAGASRGVGGRVAGVVEVGAIIGQAAPAAGEGDHTAGSEPGSAGTKCRPAPCGALALRVNDI